MKVLLIGNDPYHNFLVRTELRKYFSIGSIDVVSRGSDAIKRSLLRNYDLLIMNYHLPDENGINVYNRMKKIGLDRQVIMIVKDSENPDVISRLKENKISYIMRNSKFPENLTQPMKKIVLKKGKESTDDEEIQKRIEQERIEALHQTSMTINHEVNNALTTIMGASQLLQKGKYNLSPEVKEKVKVIEDSAQRIRDTLIKMSQLKSAVSVEVPNGHMFDLKESLIGSETKPVLVE